MRTALVTAVSLVFCTLVFAEDPVDKSKHPWAKFKVGSSVKMKSVVTMMGQEQVSTGAQTLKEVTDTEFVLTLGNAEGGETTESRLPLRMKETKKVGTEKVKAAGKEHACTIWETVNDYGEGGKMTSREWVADESGMSVKGEGKMTGPAESSTTSSLIQMDEKVKVGGKELSCWVTESTTKSAQGESKAKMWMSPEVPGFLVRMETGGDSFKQTSEVVEFTVK